MKKIGFKCALVTGATSGLGKALADFLEQKGIEVIRTGRTSDTLPIDLARDRTKLLEIISAKTPDLIVNNAGFGLYGNTIDLSTQEQLAMIEVNVNAVVEISIHAARELIKAGKKGTILNISSAAAFIPSFPHYNLYGSTKCFIKYFSQSLDAELRDQGIRVLCSCPGQIATSFRARAAKGHPQKTDRRTMPVEGAVEYLWKQIERGQRLMIFDWRTRLMIWASHLIPKSLLEKILKRDISSRISPN